MKGDQNKNIQVGQTYSLGRTRKTMGTVTDKRVRQSEQEDEEDSSKYASFKLLE